MTASRALSGKGYVAEETRERVLEVAARLGYRPNPMVQALMAEVRKGAVLPLANLAWITPHTAANPADASTVEVEHGARVRAEALGYSLDPIHVTPGAHRAGKLSRMFEARGIRGAIVAPLLEMAAELDLPWSSYAFVGIGQSLGSPKLHRTMADYPHSMTHILKELGTRGYRRVGMLHQRWIDAHSGYFAQMVFEHHCLSWGLDAKQLCACYDGWKFREYRAWAEENRLDAVIGDLPYPHDYLLDEGVRIPEDLGYVAVSAKSTHPQVSGIRAAQSALGAAAVELLTAHIQRNEYGIPARAKTMLVQGEWVEGVTLPAL